jgi:DNA-binding NarL/FixJ family response regulator
VAPTRIYIADDHSLMVDALKNLIEDDGLTVVGHALDGVSALQGITELKPDVVVLDLAMPRMNGLTVTRHIKAEFPQIKIIILTMIVDSDMVIEALGLGADGYVSKSSAAHSLLEAIRAVMDGRRYISPEFDGLMPAKILSTEDLTLEDILDRALAEIVGGFCHDIGDDLQTSLLLLKQKKYVKAQKVGADAAASLRGLHEFVRQFYTGAGFKTTSVDASSIETIIRGICSHVLRDRGIAVHVESSGFEIGSVPSLLLRHLIAPLVHNAAEAIELAKRENGCIWLKLAVNSPGNLVRIVVEDNGIGWGGRQKVVEKALKGGQTVSTKDITRGFGLQNIWRLVSRIGGNVELSDRPIGGARVEICFEIRYAHREPAKDQKLIHEPKQSELELTPRQKAVLRLLAQGYSMKEIAFSLNVSPRTVAFHKHTLMKQLNVSSTAELIACAITNSIVKV